MISKYNVLVDSSIWIEYFRKGTPSQLDILINEDFICINEVVLTELIPSLKRIKRTDVINSLNAVRKIPLDIDWEIIRKYQIINLQNGIHKVGIPDLIILQQVIDEKLTLFSFDKHFMLMKDNFKFDLIY